MLRKIRFEARLIADGSLVRAWEFLDVLPRGEYNVLAKEMRGGIIPNDELEAAKSLCLALASEIDDVDLKALVGVEVEVAGPQADAERAAVAYERKAALVAMLTRAGISDQDPAMVSAISNAATADQIAQDAALRVK